MLTRTRFHFESPDGLSGGTPDPAATPEPTAVDGGAGADPTAVAAPVPSGGEPPAPPWTDSLEFREAVAAAAMQQQQALLEQYGIGQDPEPLVGDPDKPDPALLDPYSEDFGANLVSTLEQRMQAMLDAKLSPLEQRLQQQAEREQQEMQEEGRERIKDVLTAVQAKPDSLGEFQHADSEQQAIDLAETLFGRYQAAYGNGPKAAEMAIEAAYRQVRERENQLILKGEELYKNRLATLAGAPAVPGAPVAGVQQTPTEFGSVAELGRYLDRQRRPSI